MSFNQPRPHLPPHLNVCDLSSTPQPLAPGDPRPPARRISPTKKSAVSRALAPLGPPFPVPRSSSPCCPHTGLSWASHIVQLLNRMSSIRRCCSSMTLNAEMNSSTVLDLTTWSLQTAASLAHCPRDRTSFRLCDGEPCYTPVWRDHKKSSRRTRSRSASLSAAVLQSAALTIRAARAASRVSLAAHAYHFPSRRSSSCIFFSACSTAGSNASAL